MTEFLPSWDDMSEYFPLIFVFKFSPCGTPYFSWIYTYILRLCRDLSPRSGFGFCWRLPATWKSQVNRAMPWWNWRAGLWPGVVYAVLTCLLKTNTSGGAPCFHAGGTDSTPGQERRPCIPCGAARPPPKKTQQLRIPRQPLDHTHPVHRPWAWRTCWRLRRKGPVPRGGCPHLPSSWPGSLSLPCLPGTLMWL